MNKLLALVMILSIAFLAGCGASTETAAAAVAEAGAGASGALVVEEELGIKNLLLMGLYGLQDTDHPLSAEQASALATLWQAYKSVALSSTSATAETEALITQMQSQLTGDQIAEINSMDLGPDDLQTFYTSLGIELPTPVPGATPMVPGSGAGQSLTEEEKAARRAASGDDGGSSRSTIVIDKVIAYLLAVQ